MQCFYALSLYLVSVVFGTAIPTSLYSAPQEETENHFFNILCIFSVVVHGIGQALCQTNPPTLGNNWIHYHLVM